MNEKFVDLTLAGRPVARADDLVRRYCGLTWSGGAPEVWAYKYFDDVATDPHEIGPADVTATAALHPQLSAADLRYFAAHSTDLEHFLAGLPQDIDLADASDGIIEQLTSLESVDGVSLGLATKVLHRKRPKLIPLVDRHVIDWYRPITGERSARRAWPRLIKELQADLQLNQSQFQEIHANVDPDLNTPLSSLRALDIALWMGSRR